MSADVSVPKENAIHPDTTESETPVENFRPIKVIVVGAGFSGILLGIRLPQRIRNIDLTIYEKNDGIGGTWWENRYPGCACDVPSHSYQYSFEPNPLWSSYYSPAAEICDYLTTVAKKYSADRFIRCGHRVTKCDWNEATGRWSVTVENKITREVFVDNANILILARGLLNDIAWPDIPGLKSFAGEMMHSAAWNEKYDFQNKHVGVIGNGSSAIQIIPNLRKVDGIHLTSCARSRTWLTPPFGERSAKKLGHTHLDFTPEEHDRLSRDPEYLLHFRRVVEQEGNLVHDATIKDSPTQTALKAYLTENMKQRLSRKPELLPTILPSFAVGCRRITPGPGYLEALTEPNVTVINDPISHVSPSGIHLQNGQDIALDVIVCATGFNTSTPPPFPIAGRNGKTIQSRFNPHPESYLSLAVDSFPNMFLMLGPNAGVGTGSVTGVMEAVADYITKIVRKVQKENIRAIEPKSARVTDFSQLIDAYFPRTVFLDDCKSWYRSEGGCGNRIVGLWPGSSLHALETLRSPRWEDFEYLYEGEGEGKEVNMLGWMQSGVSVVQQLGQGEKPGDKGNLVFYLEPDYVDVPATPLPELSVVYQKRAFSY